MVRGHEEPHFDAIPFKQNPEKFFGSAREYARQEKKKMGFAGKIEEKETSVTDLLQEMFKLK